MARGGRRGWTGLALLVVGLAGCGGGAEKESDNESAGRSLGGPSSVVAATPQPTPTPAPSPTPDPGAPAVQPTPSPTPAAASVAYEQDIRPILEVDCLPCHSQFASYAGTMAYVVPGSANSRLVVATQAGGAMYGHLSGNRTAKSDLIRRWVVDNSAALSR